MLSVAAFLPQKSGTWVTMRPLGCFLGAFWPPLGHPLERNRDAFFWFGSREGPPVDLDGFGSALEVIWDGCWRF